MTKRFIMLLSAVLLMSASAMAQSVTPKKADVNGDKVVDAADLVSVIDVMKKGGGTAIVTDTANEKMLDNIAKQITTLREGISSIQDIQAKTPKHDIPIELEVPIEIDTFITFHTRNEYIGFNFWYKKQIPVYTTIKQEALANPDIPIKFEVPLEIDTAVNVRIGDEETYIYFWIKKQIPVYTTIKQEALANSDVPIEFEVPLEIDTTLTVRTSSEYIYLNFWIRQQIPVYTSFKYEAEINMSDLVDEINANNRKIAGILDGLCDGFSKLISTMRKNEE